MRNCCTPAFALVLLFSSPFGPQSTAQQKNADNGVVGADQTETPAVLLAAAWTRLEDGVNGTKNTQTRTDAIAGLSLLGGLPRAEKLIRGTLHDADIDVHLASIVAAGEMDKGRGSRGEFATELRNQLNDADPKVAFTAASTLWKQGDVSGEDILAAVAQGERSGDYSFWKNSKLNASRTLHSPTALAKIAAQQGMLILVPPVGIGMGAYGYLKGAGGLSPQVIAITQIATEHTGPVKHALIEATKVKDTGARVAAAEALATYRGDDEVRAALSALLTDSKETVRFTASAAYIRVSSAPAVDPSLPRAGSANPMDAVERFRKLALALPEAFESSHGGAADFRVRDRIFATLAYVARGLGTLKLTLQQQETFLADAPEYFEPAPGGWGRMGMTLVKLDARQDVIAGALQTAYNNVIAKSKVRKRAATARVTKPRI